MLKTMLRIPGPAAASAIAALLWAPTAAPAEKLHHVNGLSVHDGVWVIDATTSSFFCPVRRKQIMAQVREGKVVKLSGLPGSASGVVSGDGAVAINLRVLGYSADVNGRLGDASGQGDWSSNSMLCAAGKWRAQVQR